jgi:hypothetical protein
MKIIFQMGGEKTPLYKKKIIPFGQILCKRKEKVPLKSSKTNKRKGKKTPIQKRNKNP